MKLPWTLELHNYEMKEKLNKRLSSFRKPFLKALTFICSFVTIGILIYDIVYMKKTIDTTYWDSQKYYGIAVLLLTTIGSMMMLFFPKNSTSILMVVRFLICMGICYFNASRFGGKDSTKESAIDQFKWFLAIYKQRQSIINIYICTSIFLTPFLDNFFGVFGLTSLCFTMETVLINILLGKPLWSVVTVPQWMMLMFLSSYSFRRVITEFFVMTTEAENTRDSLT